MFRDGQWLECNDSVLTSTLEAPKMGYLFFYEKVQEIHQGLDDMSNDIPEEQVHSSILETNLCQHKRHISDNSDDFSTNDSWKKVKEGDKDISQNVEGNLDDNELGSWSIETLVAVF